MKQFPVIDMKATGQNLKQIRTSRGYKMKTLIEYLGLTPESTAPYRWEKGLSLPAIENLTALSALYGLTINDILILREDP